MEARSIPVHQFSRAFINIHRDPNYGWVSGGYDTNNPIFRESSPVPPVIVNEVRKRNFALNDNYQPRQNELALIARNIYDFDKEQRKYRNGYSVLAVANLQNDGGRPLIGYRYFWLDLSQATALKYPNIQPVEKDFQRLLLDGVDGIWTLFSCWFKRGQAKFSMGENDSTITPYLIYDRHEIYEQTKVRNNHDDDDRLSQLIYRLKPPARLNYEDIQDFHSRISQLKNEIKYPLSWAYNVKVLENPGEFLGIALTNDAPQLSPISFQPIRVELQGSSLNKPDEVPEMPSSDSVKIKQALKELANKASSSIDDSLNLKKIIKKILDYRASDPDSLWGEVHIDKTMAKKSFVYNAILMIFCPDHIDLWFQNQFLPRVDKQAASQKSNFPLNFGQTQENDRELTTALKIQRLIFDCVQDHSQRAKLECRLLVGVYKYLEQILLNSSPLTPTNQYLLSEDTIWKSCFQMYMKECLDPESRQFIFMLSNDFWKSNKYLPRDKNSVHNLLIPELTHLPFKGLHEAFIDQIITANSLPRTHRRQVYSQYQEIAKLANTLGYPEFHRFFIRLSGFEKDEDTVRSDQFLDRVLIPRPSHAKKNENDLTQPTDLGELYVLLLILSAFIAVIGIVVFFLLISINNFNTDQIKIFALFAIGFIALMTFLISSFHRSGISLLNQFGMIACGGLLSLFYTVSKNVLPNVPIWLVWLVLPNVPIWLVWLVLSTVVFLVIKLLRKIDHY